MEFLHNARRRAKTKGVSFEIDSAYLLSIAEDQCPVFKIDFTWGRVMKAGKGHTLPTSPSLDRIIPELGYVPGNVVFISHRANKVKQDVTEVELYAVADWLHDKRKEVLNAFKIKHAPLPGAHYSSLKTPGRRGTSSPAWDGQNGHDTNYYQGELFGTHPGGCT
jgi:hypothetical protein